MTPTDNLALGLIIGMLFAMLCSWSTFKQHRNARLLLRYWVHQQGHNRCWYYPDVFNALCRELDVSHPASPELPPRDEFRRCCQQYEAVQYEPKES